MVATMPSHSIGQFSRQAEFGMFLDPFHGRDFDRTEAAQGRNDVFHHVLGRRGARGNSYDTCVADPCGIEFAAIGNQVARYAAFRTDFTQPVRIRTVGGADHQNDIHARGQFPHRALPILRSVANIACIRPDQIGESAAERRNDITGVVHGQRGLGDICDWRIGRQVHAGGLGLVLHENHLARNLPHRTFHLGMAGVTDQDHMAAGGRILAALVMDLDHQRASGVDGVQLAALRLGDHIARDSMRAEDGDGVARHLVELLDKACPFLA